MMTLSERCPDLMVPVKAIRLPGGQCAIVDPEDYQAVIGYKWFVTDPHKDAGGQLYVQAWIWDQKMVKSLQGFLAGHKLTRHINGDRFDNRRANLREITPGQRQHSRRPVPGSSSRFKGVSWVKRRSLWRAQIMHRGRTITLGFFSDEIEAARAYDRMAVKIHGERAVTNESLRLY